MKCIMNTTIMYTCTVSLPFRLKNSFYRHLIKILFRRSRCTDGFHSLTLHARTRYVISYYLYYIILCSKCNFIECYKHIL